MSPSMSPDGMDALDSSRLLKDICQHIAKPHLPQQLQTRASAQEFLATPGNFQEVCARTCRQWRGTYWLRLSREHRWM